MYVMTGRGRDGAGWGGMGRVSGRVVKRSEGSVNREELENIFHNNCGGSGVV